MDNNGNHNEVTESTASSQDKVSLFVKFDNDEEIEMIKSDGKEFKISLLPGATIEFDNCNGKTLKMTCKSV